MSKERELLERALQLIDDAYEGKIALSLCNEIKELLAQLESKQEPVAWITEWVQRYRHNDTPIIDRAVSFTKGDAPAVPNPNYIPLYTAPPKRERINHDDILDRSIDGSFEYRDGFMDGVLYAEKEHGIGGEE